MFSAQEKRRRYLQVEAALAEAEGELGFIPAEAAAEIARVARTSRWIPPVSMPASPRTGTP